MSFWEAYLYGQAIYFMYYLFILWVLPLMKGEGFVENLIKRNTKGKSKEKDEEVFQKYRFIIDNSDDNGKCFSIFIFIIILGLIGLVSLIWPLSVIISVIEFITKKIKQGGIQ